MMDKAEAKRFFEEANNLITRVQSPSTRPHSVAIRRSDGQYTVEVSGRDRPALIKQDKPQK